MAKGSKTVKPQGAGSKLSQWLFGTGAKAGNNLGDSLLDMHKPKPKNATGAKTVKPKK